VPDDEDPVWVPCHCFGGDARLLRAGREVIDQHPEAPSGGRVEAGRHGYQVVDAVEHFDDHAFDAQVIAPDSFDEFSVVSTFHPDARRTSDTGTRTFNRCRSRGGALGVRVNR
jgi:hypothetical protein